MQYGSFVVDDSSLSKKSTIKDLKNHIIKNILTPNNDPNNFNLFFGGRSPSNIEIIGDLVTDDRTIFHCFIRSALSCQTEKEITEFTVPANSIIPNTQSLPESPLPKGKDKEKDENTTTTGKSSSASIEAVDFSKSLEKNFKSSIRDILKRELLAKSKKSTKRKENLTPQPQIVPQNESSSSNLQQKQPEIAIIQNAPQNLPQIPQNDRERDNNLAAIVHRLQENRGAQVQVFELDLSSIVSALFKIFIFSIILTSGSGKGFLGFFMTFLILAISYFMFKSFSWFLTVWKTLFSGNQQNQNQNPNSNNNPTNINNNQQRRKKGFFATIAHLIFIFFASISPNFNPLPQYDPEEEEAEDNQNLNVESASNQPPEQKDDKPPANEQIKENQNGNGEQKEIDVAKDKDA